MSQTSVPSLRVSSPSRRTSKYPDFVPANYTEFFDHYYDYVTALVRQSGIDLQNSEDVAMAILTKFFEHDVLTDYSPDFTSNHGGVARKAVFRTFLSGFVKSYVRHYLDRQALQKKREPFSTDWERSSEEGDTDLSWADVSGIHYTDNYDRLEMTELVTTVRNHLSSLPPEPTGRCHLLDLFDATLEHAISYGKPNVEILALHFDVSETTVRTRLHRMKIEIHEVLTA